jgi:hypothetical protein
MELLPTDFESAASASSAIPARLSTTQLTIGAVSYGCLSTMAIVSLARQPSGRKAEMAHLYLG